VTILPHINLGFIGENLSIIGEGPPLPKSVKFEDSIRFFVRREGKPLPYGQTKRPDNPKFDILSESQQRKPTEPP